MKIMLNGGHVGQFKTAATVNLQNRRSSASPRTAYLYYSLEAKCSDGQPITCFSYSTSLTRVDDPWPVVKQAQRCHPPTQFLLDRALKLSFI